MNTLLQSVTLHEKAHPLHNKIVDIRISNGLITAIKEQLTVEATDTVVPLKGTSVSYGWFDPEVSFSQPGYEHKGLLVNDLNQAAQVGIASVGLMRREQRGSHQGLCCDAGRARGNGSVYQ